MLISVANDIRKKLRDTCFGGSWEAMLTVLKFEKEMTEDPLVKANYENEIIGVMKIIESEKKKNEKNN